MILDDSSGATLELACAKRAKPKVDDKNTEKEIGNGNVIGEGKGKSHGVTASGNTIDLGSVDVGSVIKVKGGIGEFRGVKQMRDTNSE